jgi:hypothetical protein
MPIHESSYWSSLLQQTLDRYREPLLRQVVANLLKPRSQWPVPELIERCLALVGNAAVIDRRLQELEPAGRQILALIEHSRQPLWRLGSMVEMLITLGHADGLKPVLELLEAGLLYTFLPPSVSSLGSFEEWLGQAGGADLKVFAHPGIAARALGEPLGMPELLPAQVTGLAVHETDGLEWPLRLAVLWQQANAAPLRRTQQGDFFKRDLERLRQDNLLNSPPADNLMDQPDLPLLAVALAENEGLLIHQEGEVSAAPLPAFWEDGLDTVLKSLFACLPNLNNWNPIAGSTYGQESHGNPFASACHLALLILASQPEDQWFHPEEIETWLLSHHPFWKSEDLRPSRREPWMGVFLLGLAHSLRLIAATKDSEGNWVVRLSAYGRWLLGVGQLPANQPVFPQTLFVQPNLEIVVYRQGLNPALILRLTQIAGWKSLGAACTLQLAPETIYRALETGLTFDAILQLLEQHGMRPTPTAVVEALRTWSNKRDRISVYPSASLLEFITQEDLNEAIARGLPAIRVSDRMALVTQEDEIDYKNFRLTGTRDYSLPPEKCVTVEPDGVTLNVDLTKSDLLLETELPRFTERVDQPSQGGRRVYRVTPTTLAQARESGMSLGALETWFQQRAGQLLSSAALLFFNAAQCAPANLKRLLILEVDSEDTADGLMQWPATRELIHDRLGPQALVVEEEMVQKLLGRLTEISLKVAESKSIEADYTTSRRAL